MTEDQTNPPEQTADQKAEESAPAKTPEQSSAPEKKPEESAQDPALPPQDKTPPPSSATNNPLEEPPEEDELEIETDGDVFWLVQKIFWNVLKVVIVVGILGGVVWLIWGGTPDGFFGGGDDTPDKKPVVETPKKPTSQPKPPATKSKVPSQKTDVPTLRVSLQGNPVSQVTSWHYWLERNRLHAQAGTLSDAVLWTRRTEALFEIPFAQQIRAPSPAARSLRIEKLMGELYRLVQSSGPILSSLANQMQELTARATRESQIAQTNEAAFLRALDRSDPENLETFLKKKIEAEEKELRYSIQAEARQILGEKITQYRLVLENVYENIDTNREALVQDIRVVDFPNDPFGRVIPLQQAE